MLRGIVFFGRVATPFAKTDLAPRAGSLPARSDQELGFVLEKKGWDLKLVLLGNLIAIMNRTIKVSAFPACIR